MIGGPNQVKIQIDSLLRQTDYLVTRYQSTSDKTHLLEALKLQAQIIDTLMQSAGMGTNPSRRMTLQNLR